MNELQERDIQCPYCGETIEILIDCSVSYQQYIEDCQVCCHPITIEISMNYDNEIEIYVSDEDS